MSKDETLGAGEQHHADAAAELLQAKADSARSEFVDDELQRRENERHEPVRVPSELWAIEAPMPIMRPGAPHSPLALPWAIIAPHAKQAPLNFRSRKDPDAPGKTLEQLRDAGGISAAEAVCIIEERAFEDMDDASAFERLAELVRAAGGGK